MSTLIVGEKRTGNSGISLETQGVVKFTDTFEYLIATTSTSTTREEVLFTPGLPIVGSTTQQNGAVCKSLSATRRDDNALYWDVVATFETRQLDQDTQGGNPDPTTWRPIVKVGFEQYSTVITEDKSDPPKPIVNSAGQKFETPLVEEKLVAVVNLTQFEDPDQDVGEIMTRANLTNSEELLGADVDTLLLTVKDAELGNYGDYRAWKVSYQLKYNPDGWEVKLLNVGSAFKNVSGELEPYMVKGYVIVGNLESDGTKRSMDEDPITVDFKIYKSDPLSFLRV